MTKDSRNRLIALATSVVGGLIVRFCVNSPLLAVVTFVGIMLFFLFVFAKGFPVVLAFDRGVRENLGFQAFDKNQSAAHSNIVDAAHTTQRLDIMLIRGHTFILDHDSLLDNMLDKTQSVKVRILLLAPEGSSMQAYIAKMNLNEEQKKQYLQKCSLVAEKLISLKNTNDLEYKYYDFFPSWKLIITDSRMFVAAYDATHRGSNLPVSTYHDMGMPYFIAFSNYFQQIWNGRK
jgi:hypothetical protein